MKIVAISTSDKKGMRKGNVPSAEVRANHGIVGDAHAGDWHRQVSLLATESIAKMVKLGLTVGPGDFAENIATEGIDLVSQPIGRRLRLGGQIEVEVTQIGKECHARCAIYEQAGDCVMPREGIFVKVITGGTLNVGDAIEVLGESPVELRP